MRKATLVLATFVAFLLFVVPNSYAGIKKKVQMPVAHSVANGSGIPVRSGNSLSIPGALQGEFIPGDNPSRTTPIKVLPTIDFSIPRTINAVKGILKNNAASIAVGGVISGLVVGLDWVMDEGSQAIKKPVPSAPVNPATGSIYWCWQNANGGCIKRVASVEEARQAHIDDKNRASDPGFATYQRHTLTKNSDTYYTFTARNHVGSIQTSYAKRYGSCPAGWLPDGGECPSSAEPVYAPVTDADLDLVDAYVTSQSSDWLRDILRESCEGSLSPARCYEDLKDNVSLTGPSTVNGPSTFTTTAGPNGTTTKETKTTFQITYGSDYFVYAPTTTTITLNPDGTTEVETEEPAEEEEPAEDEIDATIGDPYAPVVDKYNDIAGGLGDLEGNMSFINYGPWYSFGGACSPITLNLPVMGVYTIDHCPYVIDWIRPTLGFLFAVWTWLHCFALWRETLQNARPI